MSVLMKSTWSPAASAPTYNDDMAHELFDEMKRYVGLSEKDGQRLADLKGRIAPRLSGMADVFYETLIRHPGARAVFEDDLGRIDRLKCSLLIWLGELFDGIYDDAYFERRCRIGRVHVLVNLPPHYMFTAMNVLRRELSTAIEELNPPDRPAVLASLHKVLDLELAIMNETFREDSMSKLREVEQARHRAELSRSEHLAAVGELAASLAHEIKNPLAGISGAIQIFGDELAEDHPHKEIIAESLRQIDRLDAAVKDLLIYARPRPPVFAPASILPLLERTVMILREEPAFKGVRVEVVSADGDRVLRVDERMLQQVFANLLINAAHACRNTGKIRCVVSPGENSVRITIEDNGIGMDSAALKRAFEPFFTTKARGTGLGLAICKRIVESHDGAITLESRPGHGTRAIIDLPEAP